MATTRSNYVRVAVFIMWLAGVIFAPASAAAEGSITAHARWVIPDTAARFGPDDLLWVGLSDDKGTDLTATDMALVWWQDTSSFFPVGKLSLFGPANLLPETSRPVPTDDTLYRLDLATITAPNAGHAYDVTISHRPEDGTWGVRIVDAEQGRAIISLVRDGVAADANMGSAAAGMQLAGHNIPVTAHTEPHFLPTGATWLWRRDGAHGETSYILQKRQPVNAGDELAVEINSPVALPGKWRFTLQSGEETRVLAQVPAASGSTDVPLVKAEPTWLGAQRLTLEYVDKDTVLMTDTIHLIAGRVDVIVGQPIIEWQKGSLHVPLTVESTFPVAFTLTIQPDVTQIVWDEATRRYAHVPIPLPVEPAVAVNTGAGEAATAALDFPLPPAPGTYTLRLRAQHDIPHDIALNMAENPVAFTTVQPKVNFKVITYNVWATEQWPRRQAAFRAIVEAMQPDILALQELRPQTMFVLDDLLPHHDRVRDTFVGWVYEGNIYWSKQLFELVEYGAEDIGIYESARRLFWVRLRVKETGDTLLVGNAHYTWDGHARILAEGGRPRVNMARLTVGALDKLSKPGEAVVFLGDLNESAEAIDVLREGGLRDSVGTHGEPLKYTHPADPAMGNHRIVIDWQLHRGPLHVMESEVVDFFHEGIAPSDHKPVAVVYGLVN